MSKFENLRQIILNRRTCKEFDPPQETLRITRDVIEELLNLAIHAPNHRLTEPWRFRVLSRNFLREHLQTLTVQAPKEIQPSLQKTLDKVVHIDWIIYVTSQVHDQSIVTQENRDATSAAIQNLLLGATAMDIQTYWSTSKTFLYPPLLSLLEIKENEEFCGAIWLGRGKVARKPERTLASKLTQWFE